MSSVSRGSNDKSDIHRLDITTIGLTFFIKTTRSNLSDFLCFVFSVFRSRQLRKLSAMFEFHMRCYEILTARKSFVFPDSSFARLNVAFSKLRLLPPSSSKPLKLNQK